MLKALQRTGEEEEDDPDLEQKLDEADEALIKSIFHAPKEFVKRIDDHNWDDDDNIDNDVKEDERVKRRQVSENACAPTDILAKINSNGENKNSESSKSKPIIKTPAMTFKVKKKQDEKVIAEKKDKSIEEQAKNDGGSSVLHSLAQYDDSDDDE